MSEKRLCADIALLPSENRAAEMEMCFGARN
jgi:hypothetical protein